MSSNGTGLWREGESRMSDRGGLGHLHTEELNAGSIKLLFPASPPFSKRPKEAPTRPPHYPCSIDPITPDDFGRRRKMIAAAIVMTHVGASSVDVQVEDPWAGQPVGGGIEDGTVDVEGP